MKAATKKRRTRRAYRKDLRAFRVFVVEFARRTKTTMATRILFLVTLLGFSIAAFDPAARSQEKPVYEVYAISYGVIPDFPVSSLVAGADQSRKLDIQMMVWLLKGPAGRNILVDSGFYRDKFIKQWKVKDFIKPSDAVARLGL